ncbi:MAG: nucleotidyltransferase domain-containing protein [Caldilineaceae bacterium]
MNLITQERTEVAETIFAQLKKYLPAVLSNYPVEMAYLYGSMARKQPLPDSDVDIALVLSEELPSSYAQLLLETKIQSALEDACGLGQLDVRAINHAPLTVQGTVVQEGILLYSRDKDVRVAFEVAVRKRYFDYLPTLERMQRAFLKHVHEKGLVRGQHKNRHIHSQ